MRLNAEALRTWRFAEEQQQYDERDSIIYALGVGAGVEPDELQFVYEKMLRTLPTMAVTLAAGASRWFCDPRSGVELSQVFHAEQQLEIHHVLPPAATVVARTKIDSISDKGAGRAAVVVQSRTLHDSNTQTLLATARATLIVRGAGGFGGGEDRPAPGLEPPGRNCDLRLTLQTRKDQGALYRLSGDLNPLHIDPAAARLAGFDQPVLHGLCTYGMGGRAVVRSVCEGEPGRLRFLSARFVAPVFPGDALSFEIWRVGTGTAAFRASVEQRGAIVLGNGLARYES